MEIFFAYMLGRLVDPFAFLGYIGIGILSRRWWWTLPLVTAYGLTYEYLAFVMLPSNGFPNRFMLPQIIGGMLLASATYFLKRLVRKRDRVAAAS